MFKQVFCVLFGMLMLSALSYGKSSKLRPSTNEDDDANLIDLKGKNEEFEKQLLRAHNDLRARHCVSPLRLDKDLSRRAQQQAQRLADSNGMSQSRPSDLGQNMFMKSVFGGRTNEKIHGDEVANEWYRGGKSYNYNRGGFSMETGSFTQLVWKNSQRIGVGIAYTADGQTEYVIAYYSPPGNFGNQYRENVLPAKC
ncbi:unnamed protein product [Adineta ricciae]|uniref:SCP domain-containing protein n=1 Tax=Adineta ricciae TaxID=249248 RepID=A0A814C9E6_ADIRI|nr:unnamed protein product [Adineta ricciae]CAF1485382.1 unnamed protein product [Adineta ricciae]